MRFSRLTTLVAFPVLLGVSNAAVPSTAGDFRKEALVMPNEPYLRDDYPELVEDGLAGDMVEGVTHVNSRQSHLPTRGKVLVPLVALFALLAAVLGAYLHTKKGAGGTPEPQPLEDETRSPEGGEGGNYEVPGERKDM